MIVTGGSMGIGEGCVRAYHAAGAKVVYCSRKSNGLEAQLNAMDGPGEATWIKCDVSNEGEIAALIAATVEKYGAIDVLLNNAGWHPPPLPIDEFSTQDLRDLFQLNFVSYFLACKLALPELRKSKGNIINMSSWVGAYGQSQAVTYSATKGAITSFSKSLAIDEAKAGVRVNVISPGNIWTPLWKSWSDGEVDPEAAVMSGDTVQPLDGGRKGSIAESGRLALAISADLTFTTGVDHILSGGAELGYGVKA